MDLIEMGTNIFHLDKMIESIQSAFGLSEDHLKELKNTATFRSALALAEKEKFSEEDLIEIRRWLVSLANGMVNKKL